MSLKKDARGRRSVEMELELPGTPEQIWQAMATGPGYSAWFVPTEVEEREGGVIRFHLGGDMTSSGTVTTWQPPTRFAYEEPGWSGEAAPLATEVIIEAQSGGTCRVRMVHSLFADKDDWDNEIESMENGWPAFFRILNIYLKFFAGERAASMRPTGTFAGAHAAAWLAIQKSLGLDGAVIGDHRDTSVNGAPCIAGIVEDIRVTSKDQALLLRIEAPASGVALIGSYEWGGKVHVAISLFFYGDDADTVMARENPKWEAWMARHFSA